MKSDADGAMHKVEGDASRPRLMAGWLNDLVSDAEQCAKSDTTAGVAHTTAHRTRFNLWTGQSSDGQMWAKNLGEKVKPCDGRMDLQCLLVDTLVTEDTALALLATMGSDLVVRGIEGGDDEQAANANLYLRWVIENELGFDWVVEWARMASYVYGDDPGIGLMRVVWRRRVGLDLRRLTPEGLGRLYVESLGPVTAEQRGVAEQAVAEIAAAIESGAVGPEDLALSLREYFPHLTENRARLAAADLIGTGECEFPVEVVRKDGPEIEALRYGEDWFVPWNTRRFQEARVWFGPELLSRSDVEEAAQEEGWSEAFKKAVLNSVGQARFFRGSQRLAAGGSTTDSTSPTESDDLRGLCEVVRAEFRAATDDGVVGVFETTFSLVASLEKKAEGKEDGAAYAFEPRLVGHPHGHYSGHVIAAETVNGRLLDARGVPALAGTAQWGMKRVLDRAGDHAIIAPLPPVLTKGRRSQGGLKLGALKEVALEAEGDAAFMRPPEYPATAYKFLEKVQGMVDARAGRENATNPEVLARAIRQWKVTWWLANVREVLRQLLQLGQANETPERMRRIVNDDGLALTSAEDIAGQFNLFMAYSVEDLAPEAAMKKLEALASILGTLDNEGVVNKSTLALAGLRRLAPEWAAVAGRTRAKALRDTETAAREDLLTILAGAEPERKPDGSVDYSGQLAWFRGVAERNPTAYDWLPADRRALLEAHIQYLTAQAQQYGANRQIGREGAPRALAPGGGGAE